jgi:tetratricopeptide (TPR) repeat protein
VILAAVVVAVLGASALRAQDSRPETVPDYAATVARLKPAFDANADDLEANLGLAEAYLGLGDLPRARRHAERAQAVAPKDPRAAILLGHVYFQMAADDTGPDGPGLIARATLQDAAAAYEEALVLGAEPYAAAFWAADARERSGSRTKALAAIGRALEVRPNDPAAAAVKGRLLLDEGRAPEAAAVLDAALAAQPRAAGAEEAAFQAMRARLRIGDLDALPGHFAKLTRGDPHGAAGRVYQLVAASLGGTRNADLWGSMLESASAADPRDPLALYWNAERAARSMDGPAALALAERYREVRPADPDGRVFRAMALRLLGRLDEARVEIGKAYDLEPGRQSTGDELGYLVKAFFDASRYKEASQVQELVAHVSKSPQDRHDHAILLLDAGMPNEAKKIYAALVADPKTPSPERARAANAAALLLRSEGDHRGAEALFREAIGYDPANLDPRENLAILLVRTGREDEGRKELADVMARSQGADPPRKRAAYHLWRATHKDVP